MPIQIGTPHVDRGQFVHPAQIGQRVRFMLIDEFQRPRTTRSGEPILNSKGKPSQSLLITGIALDGTTMPARKTGVVPAAGDLQRFELRGRGYGAFIEAAKTVGGRQVGDCIEITAVSATTWRDKGQPDVVNTTDPAIVADGVLKEKLSWNFEVTYRRARPEEASLVAAAEAKWHEFNEPKPDPIHVGGGTPFRNGEAYDPSEDPF